MHHKDHYWDFLKVQTNHSSYHSDPADCIYFGSFAVGLNKISLLNSRLKKTHIHHALLEGTLGLLYSRDDCNHLLCISDHILDDFDRMALS